MIIAVDFDGTLLINGRANDVLLESLKMNQMEGNVIILWTCREGQRLRDAVTFLARHGFTPNFVNCNCPQGIAAMGHDSRKVYADIYIDDKNLRG